MQDFQVHLEGSSPHERIEVTSGKGENGQPTVVLTHQSWGEGIGWYAQSSVTLEPNQFEQLKRAMCLPNSPTRRTSPTADEGPRIIRFPTGQSR